MRAVWNNDSDSDEAGQRQTSGRSRFSSNQHQKSSDEQIPSRGPRHNQKKSNWQVKKYEDKRSRSQNVHSSQRQYSHLAQQSRSRHEGSKARLHPNHDQNQYRERESDSQSRFRQQARPENSQAQPCQQGRSSQAPTMPTTSSRNRKRESLPIVHAESYELDPSNISLRPKIEHAPSDKNHQSSGLEKNVPTEKRVRFLGFRKLEELVDKDSNEILLTLLEPNGGLKEFLSTASAKRDVVALFLISVSKTCDSLHKLNVSALINTITQSSNFMYGTLMPYLSSFESSNNNSNHKDSLFSLVDILTYFQDSSPASASQFLSVFLPVLKELCVKVLKDKELCDIQDMIKNIEKGKEKFLKDHTKDEIKNASMVENSSCQQPPEDYRQIPILPTKKDICEHKPFLRPNIVNGKYADAEHYLDVQFRLLREDYVKPLREGIATIKRLNSMGKPLSKQKDVKIYQDVHIIKQEFLNGSLIHVAKFDINEFKRIKWEHSKRFLTGSLLCFSLDNFETMFFASVATRDCEQLNKGLLILKLEDPSIDALNISPLESFLMLETSAYFEAYRHNLAALVEMTPDDFPFSRYIVNVDKEMHYPVYLEVITSYDLQPLMKLNKTIDYDAPFFLNPTKLPVTLLKDSEWPTSHELGLDESQYIALKTALTHEFSIIQGPPGTGKTYVGLGIVKLLLHNFTKWNFTRTSPILIVCYTNHALDQFLEGIQKFTTDIVRIGGRCANEQLSEYRLFNLKQKVRSKREVPHHIFSNIKQMQLVMSDLKSAIEESSKEISDTYDSILGEDLLKSFIEQTHYDTLKSESKKYGSIIDDGFITTDWLGIRYREFKDMLGNQQPLHNHGSHNNVIYIGKDNIAGDCASNINFNAVKIVPNQLNQIVVDNVLQKKDGESDGEEDDVEFIEGMREVDTEDFSGVLNLADMQDWKEVKGGKEKGGKKKKDFINKQLNNTIAMSEQEVKDVINVWQLDDEMKWRLYKYWLQKYVQLKQEELLELQAEMQIEYKKLEEMRTEEDLFVLKQAKIVGMTTTGAAKYRNLVKNIKPKIIVIEEAAEILEAHIVTTITEDTEHVILIGDHQQLRPSPNVYQLAIKYNLDVSLFERLVKNGLKFCQLTKQHRMRPEIAELLVPNIYPNLINDKSVYDYGDIKGVTKNVFFLNHNELEGSEMDSKSKVNEHEAKFIIQLCKYLVLQGYDASQITILTTYSGQLFAFKRLKLDILKGVRITVVDNFQGEENDIILMSFVRSNEDGAIGFLKVSNRVCVALSRAKIGLFCIGNFELLSEKSELWRNIVKTLERQHAIGAALRLQCQNHPEVFTDVSTSIDFNAVPEGGCTRLCEYRLICGHTCPKMCHSYDRDHEEFQCRKKCEKVLCELNHKCPKKCYEECGQCTTKVARVLPLCGHRVSIPCHIDPALFICLETCNNILRCGHNCKQKCTDVCSSKKCEEMVNIMLLCGHPMQVMCKTSKEIEEYTDFCKVKCKSQLQCGHMCSGTCGECCQQRLHKLCQKPCTRILVCGHECKSTCSTNCPPCKKKCENRCFHSVCPKRCGEPCDRCAEACAWRCEHSECTMLCGDLCFREPCNLPCNKILKCRHKCVGLCSEPCPDCATCNPEVREIFFGSEEEEDARFVKLEDCGHAFTVEDLTQWMILDDKSEIQMKSCPKCKTVIRRNLRFGNAVKISLSNIEKVKKVVFGDTNSNDSKRNALITKIKGYSHIHNFVKLLNPTLNFLEQKTAKPKKKISNLDLLRCENVINVVLEYIVIDEEFRNQHYSMSVEGFKVKFIQFTQQTRKIISDFIEKYYMRASEEQLAEITWELQRYKFINKVTQFVNYRISNTRTTETMPFIDQLLEHLCKLGPFRQNEVQKVSTAFTELSKLSGSAIINISQEEKQMVLKAMNLSQGHYYQCPKGHVYCITECGGAMVESKCNECGAAIGGGSHRLRSDNRVARDMDGSTHSAWPGNADMGNYEFL